MELKIVQITYTNNLQLYTSPMVQEEEIQTGKLYISQITLQFTLSHFSCYIHLYVAKLPLLPEGWTFHFEGIL